MSYRTQFVVTMDGVDDKYDVVEGEGDTGEGGKEEEGEGCVGGHKKHGTGGG